MVNYLAILVVAIISQVIGMLWYSPALFANKWMELSKVSKADIAKAKKKGMAKPMIIALISLLVTGWVFSLVLEAFGATTFGRGAFVGFLAWLGFTGTVTLSSVLWEGKPFGLWALNNAHTLVYFVVMSGILAIWA